MHFLIFPKQENMFCPFIQVRFRSHRHRTTGSRSKASATGRGRSDTAAAQRPGSRPPYRALGGELVYSLHGDVLSWIPHIVTCLANILVPVRKSLFLIRTGMGFLGATEDPAEIGLRRH